MEEGDWDLQAVVRGCNRGGDGGRRSLDTGTSAATIEGNYICSTTPHVSSSLVQEEYHGSISCEFRKEEEEQFGYDVFFHFPNLSTPSPSIESWAQELEQFYKPFFPSNPTFKPSFSLSSSMPPLTKPHIQKHQKQILSSSPLFHLQNNGGFAPSPSPSGKQQQRPASRLIATNTTTRPKRRKNQQKSVVCHVPADGLSSDMWAWRKYGQKPIKGSPYPRGYYRCSSSKGCLARKQVERSIKDPGVFVITYTAEHNHSVPTHRNSLAGSVRNKASQQSKPTASPMHSTTDTKVRRSRWFNPVEEEVETVVPKVKKEGEMMDNKDDDNGMLLMSDMQMLCEDDLMLLDEDEQLNSGKHFPAFPSWPWISNQTHQSN